MLFLMDFQTSIIIVSYNNFDTTSGPCLKSLLNDDECCNFEIIVVDNASKDDTPKKLEMLTSGAKNIKLMLNKSNRGFAGGNNDGANISRGEILILLNSDTIVPSGAIGKLSHLLINHPDWDMLGPVTNEAGNEQKIFVKSQDPEEILREGETWCAYSGEDYFKSERLDFFCVAIRKAAYEQLGGLDEQFGLGYFEDTDFSIRANRMGLNMIFTEDIFVYHRAGKSFSKMGKKFVKKLMRENKKKLKIKHSGKFKLHHIRHRNMNIMNQYILLKEHTAKQLHMKLDYKFHNRLQLAHNMYPNNILKKLVYNRQLKNLCRKYYQ